MDELNNGEQGQYVEPGKNEKKNNTRKIVKRTLLTAGLALAVYMVYSIVYLFISPDRNIQQIYLVPEDADICVCTDLDEVFQPGWRKLLEDAWEEGCSQASYRYTWNFTAQGQEGIVFWIEKIHARHGFRWVHPVHEVLQWVGEGMPGKTITVNGLQLNHHPDPHKSRG